MNATLFLKRHASTSLTFVGGAGVIATTVLAVKATPKALEKIDKEKEEDLTKLEIVKAAGDNNLYYFINRRNKYKSYYRKGVRGYESRQKSAHAIS